jgi:acyl carrier protein
MAVSVEEVTALFKKACPTVPFASGDEERPLKDLGVDSLDMANALLEVQERFGVAIPDEAMPDLETIAAITSYVAERARGQ